MRSYFKRADPFFDEQENHSLIGVANVFLACLFYDVKLQYAVPIINQKGEVVDRRTLPPSPRPFPPVSLVTRLRGARWPGGCRWRFGTVPRSPRRTARSRLTLRRASRMEISRSASWTVW